MVSPFNFKVLLKKKVEEGRKRRVRKYQGWGGGKDRKKRFFSGGKEGLTNGEQNATGWG